MKKLFLLFIASITLLITACNKENAEQVYFLKAQKNKATWQAVNLEAHKKSNSDTVTIIARAIPAGMKLPEETLVLAFKLNGTGNSTPIIELTHFYKTLGLDVTLNEYQITNKALYPVTIKEYNAQTGTIKGTFNMVLNNTAATATSNEIVLGDGSFYVKITTE